MDSLLDNKGNLNYKSLVKKYPWIVERSHKCILSPDSDGLLCGLLMQHLLSWEPVGFYDGKIMTLKQGIKAQDCVFLDMEIFRDFIKSIGQHMLLWNAQKNLEHPAWKNFVNCISPNNIRQFDGKKSFKRKYPLGTIHLLLGILGSIFSVPIKKEAICPLLYTDGTFKSMFNYPENVLDWLSFLSAAEPTSPLYTVFFNNSYSTSDLMIALKDFFRKIKQISGSGRGGDKIQISNSKGEIVNLEKNTQGTYDLSKEQQERGNKFLELLAQLTGWHYDVAKWNFVHFEIFAFSKGMISPNNKNFDTLLSKNPLSWAMTASTRIEYTLDEQKVLDK